MKFTQELVSIYHDNLFLVLPDLNKAYNTVDRDRLIQNLE